MCAQATEKKSQHYVPKLYLRNFSFQNNRKEIGLFNISNNFFKSNVPIVSQAKGDYFYGKDGVVEDFLGEIEGNTAPIIKNVIDKNALPPNSTAEYANLFTFALLFYVRTLNFSSTIEESMNRAVRAILKYNPNFAGNPDDWELKLTDTPAFGVTTAVEKIKNAFDLSLKLLVNQSDTVFLTSDNPLVPYNQFLEKRSHPHGRHGLYTKGLQLFLPISPLHSLVFYDGWAYKIGDRNKSVIIVKDRKDVDALNFLQIASCGAQVFFNERITQKYIEKLMPMVKKYRLVDKSILREVGTNLSTDGHEHIQFHIDNQNISAKLDFSFIAQTKKAKQHLLSPYTVQLRNEQLRPLQYRS